MTMKRGKSMDATHGRGKYPWKEGPNPTHLLIVPDLVSGLQNPNVLDQNYVPEVYTLRLL
jgi:hypothetical protein